MRIGSQDWYDMHPDAPARVDLAEDAEFEREARARGWTPPPVTGAWADALEQSRQNAMAASREPYMTHDYTGETIVHLCDDCGDDRRAVGEDPTGPGDWSYVLECGHTVFGWTD